MDPPSCIAECPRSIQNGWNCTSPVLFANSKAIPDLRKDKSNAPLDSFVSLNRGLVQVLSSQHVAVLPNHRSERDVGRGVAFVTWNRRELFTVDDVSLIT